jgi:hypothetical protein
LQEEVMRRIPWSLMLLVFAGPIAAAEPKDKVVQELWDAVYSDGQKIGSFHTTTHEIEHASQKRLVTTLAMNFQIKRGNATLQIRMETGTEETPDGKVTGVFMRQYQGKELQMSLIGTVEGKQLHVTVDNGRIKKTVPWNDQVVGLYRQEHLYQQNKVKPGDRLTYLTYEPIVNSVVTVRATVKDEEEVEIFKVKKKLLRVEAVSDKIEAGGQSFQPPPLILWLDKNLRPVRSQTELPPLGKLLLYRTTREVAMAPGGNGPDLLLNQLIGLNKPIPRPHDTRSVVFRITLKDDDDPATAFAQDDRQQVKKLEGKTIEVSVRAVREPPAKDSAEEVKPEFLKHCYWLNGDDAKVKEYASQAIGLETDPWKKARLIEQWVHFKMKKNNAVGFITAEQIARNLEGDCRQHAMLAAAMCRAAAVPSRLAVGLVYVNDTRRGPVMGFHMWLEVWIKGKWIALDPTLGDGSIGAAHLKIADHSWSDIQSQTPLLPVARVLGKVKIEVGSINGKD